MTLQKRANFRGNPLFQSHKITVTVINENIVLIRLRFVECLEQCWHDSDTSAA